jgi:hypothetical protein
MHSRSIFALALLAGASLGLAGCDTIRNASGEGKDSPDEFAVVTKAPLVIPPDFNLRPPAPGTAPANQIEPTNAAQSALFNTDPAAAVAAMPATMSMGERYLLANAGVQNADPAIRQQIAADASGMRGSDDDFTHNVLFWSGPSAAPGSVPVDADAEARKVDAARSGGSSTAPATPGAAPRPAAPPPPAKDDDSWLDHIWPF